MMVVVVIVALLVELLVVVVMLVVVMGGRGRGGRTHGKEQTPTALLDLKRDCDYTPSTDSELEAKGQSGQKKENKKRKHSERRS